MCQTRMEENLLRPPVPPLPEEPPLSPLSRSPTPSPPSSPGGYIFDPSSQQTEEEQTFKVTGVVCIELKSCSFYPIVAFIPFIMMWTLALTFFGTRSATCPILSAASRPCAKAGLSDAVAQPCPPDGPEQDPAPAGPGEHRMEH